MHVTSAMNKVITNATAQNVDPGVAVEDISMDQVNPIVMDKDLHREEVNLVQQIPVPTFLDP